MSVVNSLRHGACWKRQISAHRLQPDCVYLSNGFVELLKSLCREEFYLIWILSCYGVYGQIKTKTLSIYHLLLNEYTLNFLAFISDLLKNLL